MGNVNDEINLVLSKMNRMSALEAERIRMWDQVGGYPRDSEAGVYNMTNLSTVDNSLYQVYINKMPPYLINCPTELLPIIQKYKNSFFFRKIMKQLQFHTLDNSVLYFLAKDQSLFGNAQVIPTFLIALDGKNATYIIYICGNDAIAVVDKDKNWNVSWNELMEDMDRESIEEKYDLIERTIVYQCAYDLYNNQTGSFNVNFQAFDPNIRAVYPRLKLVSLI